LKALAFSQFLDILESTAYLRTKRQRNTGSIPGKKENFLHHIGQVGYNVHQTSYPLLARGLYPGKRGKSLKPTTRLYPVPRLAEDIW
jgi:hypothetical protein